MAIDFDAIKARVEERKRIEAAELQAFENLKIGIAEELCSLIRSSYEEFYNKCREDRIYNLQSIDAVKLVEEGLEKALYKDNIEKYFHIDWNAGRRYQDICYMIDFENRKIILDYSPWDVGLWAVDRYNCVTVKSNLRNLVLNEIPFSKSICKKLEDLLHSKYLKGDGHYEDRAMRNIKEYVANGCGQFCSVEVESKCSFLAEDVVKKYELNNVDIDWLLILKIKTDDIIDFKTVTSIIDQKNIETGLDIVMDQHESKYMVYAKYEALNPFYAEPAC